MTKFVYSLSLSSCSICERGTQKECYQRVCAESGRGMALGFDRVIFCTGFVFKGGDAIDEKEEQQNNSHTKKIKNSLFDDNVKPTLDRLQKYPLQNFDYSSRNVNGLFFAGSLQHERDYKRSAGGFVHGFRYTTRALFRSLIHDNPHDISKPGKIKFWPSKDLSKEEFASGEHIIKRINSMAGPYQMFAELCDLIVFEVDDSK